MALALITDRTAEDVARVKTLRTKINTEGWGALTSVEQSEWRFGVKGSYNYMDLNRVGKTVLYLADLLNGYGYGISVSPKTDWVKSDIPTEAQMTVYIADVNAIKDRFYGTTELPGAMDNLDYEDANNIEKLLIEIEASIKNIEAAFIYCGEVNCGEA